MITTKAISNVLTRFFLMSLCRLLTRFERWREANESTLIGNELKVYLSLLCRFNQASGTSKARGRAVIV